MALLRGWPSPRVPGWCRMLASGLLRESPCYNPEGPHHGPDGETLLEVWDDGYSTYLRFWLDFDHFARILSSKYVALHTPCERGLPGACARRMLIGA